ncbi:hypothetical protein HHI36_009717 [Cryptolaemus montrouzieri]|uniref:Uncharacterized protein n=1 Tax=Cryptolaemus montrouzieri TaxID=559131 RepID=A0ABD2MGL0_9CUCU
MKIKNLIVAETKTEHKKLQFLLQHLRKIPPPAPKKRKVSSTAKDTSHSDVDKVIHYLHNKTAREYDGIDYLFLTYAETFRKFQPATQTMLKMELATLFARTEMRELEAHNQRSVISTPQSPLHSDSCSEHSTMTFTSGDISPTYQNLNFIPSSSANSSFLNARDLYELTYMGPIFKAKQKIMSCKVQNIFVRKPNNL